MKKSGYTLLEVMVASGLAVVVVGLMISIITGVMKRGEGIRNELSTGGEMGILLETLEEDLEGGGEIRTEEELDEDGQLRRWGAMMSNGIGYLVQREDEGYAAYRGQGGLGESQRLLISNDLENFKMRFWYRDQEGSLVGNMSEVPDGVLPEYALVQVDKGGRHWERVVKYEVDLAIPGM